MVAAVGSHDNDGPPGDLVIQERLERQAGNDLTEPLIADQPLDVGDERRWPATRPPRGS
jgi:hypothetical protein